ncbi:MAG TPA: hypothetical protein VGJ64_00315 [Gemmatimonadaceae bacterium]|jgi:hypothetical protein
MRPVLVILSLTAGSALLFGATRPKPVEFARWAEVTRLQRHFDSVDKELRSRDVSSLTPAQQVRRARLTHWLREYRNAATFPKNDRFKIATPFFRDSEGTLCAMAYLIDRSGRRDIVDKVAATRNNAYIRELARDKALIAWLDSAGLTVREAARIQPQYDGPFFPPPAEDRDRVKSGFALAAVSLGSASLAATTVNIMRPTYLGGLLGVVAGTAAIIVGADHLDQNRGTKRVAIATTTLGAVSLGAGIYGFLEARREERERHRGGWEDRRRGRHAAIIAPDVTIEHNSPRVGILVHSSF